MDNLEIFTDGGARGNPGPSAIGVYIRSRDKTLAKIGLKIGITTNNVAEYSAVVKAYEFMIQNKSLFNSFTTINFFMDSELVVKQLNGLYKVKNENLRELLFKIRNAESEFKAKIFYSHVPREKNKIADYLVNLALDNTLPS